MHDIAAVLPVVIVGGGFSGAMLAARLAERGQASVLIERGEQVGLGVAYAADLDEHRLNVRAERMSARPDQPADFVNWLTACAPAFADPNGFAPRRLYGLYVQARLMEAETAHPGRIRRVRGEAVRLDGQAVILADGVRVAGRAVVLATGNPAPRPVAPGEGPRRIADPWARGALAAVGADDAVLILGTGLTMVDVVLALQAQGWRGRATAMSRRGLTPRAHRAHHDAPVELPPEALTGPLSNRLASARRLAREHGWRGVMEGYRPITAELWSAATTTERARFLRHLRPWWDVHRHRIAPEIAAALDALIAAGRLSVVAGRVQAIQTDDQGATLTLRAHAGDVQRLVADWLIDCTGPGHDAARAPLTAALIAEGRARIDPVGLGLDLDAEGRVIHADGTADPGLFALGPPARAAFWETIAVPDIRQRIEALVRVLTA
ncbi:FAD-dependent oxidoreductase [Brevundimonas naejangsanensis]|uniref:FAD-dependent oxidoreductase n=1 Tax=Brevundimonas naejangsanensis TaxID=588932 RepID=A0A494REE0_9CAUL|nr:FAD/NAD(P)-binding protein [Brevundimonas naejangsanensis]AYG94521.1 FAD-dependent oxidoreductase [Brevundimonas naejangsanensis]